VKILTFFIAAGPSILHWTADHDYVIRSFTAGGNVVISPDQNRTAGDFQTPPADSVTDEWVLYNPFYAQLNIQLPKSTTVYCNCSGSAAYAQLALEEITAEN
jgi:hypothetical protein